MNKPLFITFTGADDQTDINEMKSLASQFNIEWGILFSHEREGTGRFPSMSFVRRLVAKRGHLRLSAHLCGTYSRFLLEQGATPIDDLISEHFNRVQINTRQPILNYERIQRWSERVFVEVILQCRGDFPASSAVSWLFDASGGNGRSPLRWPEARGAFIRGYAGGLSPCNVLEELGTIATGASNYWIDMETGVRDATDRFDLSLCRQVCEKVYGS